MTTALPDDFLPVLDELNRIVLSSRDRLEGNLFYYHHEANPSRHTVYDYFIGKRRNFAAACRASSRMLEIGFNAGHSALLALAHGCEYHGVDICQYDYTLPAADYLKGMFGEQFHFHAGDSLEIVPLLAREHPYLRFDLIHIDGHHGVDYCRADTANARLLADDEAWLLIDDTDLPPIRTFYDGLVQGRQLLAVRPPGWKDSRHHAIGRILSP